MITRAENGRLFLERVKLEVFIGKLFTKCKNKKEIEWLESQMQIALDVSVEERIDEIKRED